MAFSRGTGGGFLVKTFELCRALRSAGFEEQARVIVWAASALEELLQLNPARGWVPAREVLRAEEAAGVALLERLMAARLEGLEV